MIKKNGFSLLMLESSGHRKEGRFEWANPATLKERRMYRSGCAILRFNFRQLSK